MKFRKRSEPAVLGFQIAPIVDVLLVLLCFFIVTWTLTRRENELDVKVPVAQHDQPSNPQVNQTVLNVKRDGSSRWYATFHECSDPSCVSGRTWL